MIAKPWQLHEIDDPTEIIFNSGKERKDFYRTVAVGLERPLFSVYRRVVRMYDKKNYVGKYTPDELRKLKELSFSFRIPYFIDNLESNVVVNVIFITNMFLSSRQRATRPKWKRNVFHIRLQKKYGCDWASIGHAIGRSASSVKDRCRLLKNKYRFGKNPIGSSAKRCSLRRNFYSSSN